MRRVATFGRECAAAGVVFLVPVLVLYRYLVTWPCCVRTIGNDFESLYYRYKVYLLDGLSHLRLPLWSPSEAAGFPFYANPFAQVFYPLNAPLAVLYRLRGGYSYHDHQVFTVVGIGLFALGLYGWLRSLAIDRRHAVFAALLVGTSLKITELVRFPNAVHTAAWLPFVLWGCTLIARGDRYVRGGMLVFVAMILLLTGGYFYYVYYSIFLIGPYVVLLAVPRTRRVFLPDTSARFTPFAAATFVSFAGAVALCAPYLLAVERLLSQTVDRGGGNYVFSTSFDFTAVDTIGSWVFPPASQMEGWYYFGMAGVLVLAAWYLQKTPPEDAEPSRDALKWILAVWFAAITYVTWGRHSYLFSLLWAALPGFSSLRVWGRMNIILLPLVALGLAVACARVEQMATARPVGRPFRFLGAFSGVYLAIVVVQCYLYASRAYDWYWTAYFLPFAKGFDERVFIYAGAAAYLAIAGAVLWRRRGSSATWVGSILLPSLLVLNLVDTGTVATRQWSLAAVPPRDRQQLRVETIDVAALQTPRTFAHDTISLTPAFSVGYVDNWYFERYLAFLGRYASAGFDEPKPAGFADLLGITDGRRVYFSSRIEYASIDEFVDDARSFSRDHRFVARIGRYTGDALRLTVGSDSAGYVSFIDNWAPGWVALVDRRPVPLTRLFGTFKAVKVEAGRHVVEFRYEPEIWLPPTS